MTAAALAAAPGNHTVIKALFVDLAGVLLDDAPPQSARGHGCGLRGGVGAALRLLDRLDYRVLILAPCALDRRQGARIAPDRLDSLLCREGIHLAGVCCCGATVAPCADCPPAPGLLLRAARTYGLAMEAAWLLASSTRFLHAGQQAGCRTILIGSEPAEPAEPAEPPGPVAYRSRDIVDAALAIVRIDRA